MYNRYAYVMYSIHGYMIGVRSRYLTVNQLVLDYEPSVEIAT